MYLSVLNEAKQVIMSMELEEGIPTLEFGKKYTAILTVESLKQGGSTGEAVAKGTE